MEIIKTYKDTVNIDCPITVIVPCYNHERYIIECLDSIKKQTFQNFQWIVVDDGSKDNCPLMIGK